MGNTSSLSRARIQTAFRIPPPFMLTSNAKPLLLRPSLAQWIRSSNDVTQQFLSLGSRSDVVSLAGGLPAAELYPIQELAISTQPLEKV